MQRLQITGLPIGARSDHPVAFTNFQRGADARLLVMQRLLDQLSDVR